MYLAKFFNILEKQLFFLCTNAEIVSSLIIAFKK